MQHAEQAPAIVQPSPIEIAEAREWARFYRHRGYQPLPSDPAKKKPLVRFAHWWEAEADADLFDRLPTSNLQVMTGRHWGLMVIDLDGDEAIEQWGRMVPRCPRTWITHSGGGGRHLWFSIPRDLPAFPTNKRLWGIWDEDAKDGNGDWQKHTAIERLCDRSLVMAPPSIHPRTGQRYRFLAGHSPKQIARPAAAPANVLALQPMNPPRPVQPAYVPMLRKAPGSPVVGFWDADEVLDRIGDKIALAKSWGVRFATERPNASGWCSVHRIDREDRDPSASFHPGRGMYWEPGEKTIGLFTLGVRMGQYLSFRDAVNGLGDRFCSHLRKGA